MGRLPEGTYRVTAQLEDWAHDIEFLRARVWDYDENSQAFRYIVSPIQSFSIDSLTPMGFRNLERAVKSLVKHLEDLWGDYDDKMIQVPTDVRLLLDHSRGVLVRMGTIMEADAGTLSTAIAALKAERNDDEPEVQQVVAEVERAMPNNQVFVVHGRDEEPKDLVFAIMESVGLRPRDFNDIRREMGGAAYIGDVLDRALRQATAILVLLTPDEEVRLRPDLVREGGSDDAGFQARPNVILEAGMALVKNRDQTVIVEWGNVRQMTDLSGLHTLRWNEDSPQTRYELLELLEAAGCQRNQPMGKRWMTVGKKP